MKNPNSVPGYLPRDEVFRYTDRKPALDIPELESKHDSRLDHLQEQINKLSSIVEQKVELQKKSGTRHQFLVGSGFRVVTAGVPFGWTSGGAGVTFSQQTVRPGGHRSNYSARIAAGANAGTLTQTVAVFPGQRMSMAVWVKITTGSGYVQLATNGTNAHTTRVPFTAASNGTGGFIALPSLKLTAPMVEIPLDATTCTITLSANANSTIDFCEPQYGHGTQITPHLWCDNAADYNNSGPNGGTDNFVWTSDGTNGAWEAAATADVASGVWTPGLSNVANVANSNTAEGQYLRVGTTVTCSVMLAVDVTLTATATQLGISLPVASNFGAQTDCTGVGFSPEIAGMGGGVIADATNNRAELNFVSSDLSSRQWCITFTYQVI